MNLEKLEQKLEALTSKKQKIQQEIKEINKKAKDEVQKRKPLLLEIDQEIYVKELEIKVARLESNQV